VTSPHPVRLVVQDDLKRSRLTVFFRLLLAIPHYIWAALWSFLMVFVGFVNWILTLILGRSPRALHDFIAAYLRYMTKLIAYLTLAANPYPLFTGGEDYPIELEIDEPRPQNRLITLFRLILAFPAFAFTAVFLHFVGGGTYSETGDAAESTYTAGSSAGLLWTVAFFAWFACLVLGRMPLGFRNLQAYGLRYVAQTWAYLLVITDRYPDLDPADPTSSGPDHPIRLAVTDDLRRSRLTVFFRLLLALPHLIWLSLWTIAAILAVIVSWFATLIVGRTPNALHRFLAAYVRYGYHVFAFLGLTANPFPGFTGAAGRYSIDPEIPGPERQHRLKTLFRLFLAIPALGVSGSLYGIAVVASFFGWFVSLVLGRMPRTFRDAQAYALRYGAQTSSYVWLLSDRYPFSGPQLGEPGPEQEPEPAPIESPTPA
jgi:hypothetical protein